MLRGFCSPARCAAAPRCIPLATPRSSAVRPTSFQTNSHSNIHRATCRESFPRTIDDGTLYFTVRFTDQTSFCVRYAWDMFAVGAELSDWQSGDFHIIREYMKPIPR
jgi:hypothetical protein